MTGFEVLVTIAALTESFVALGTTVWLFTAMNAL
jgi:hypothetical protein